MSESSVWVLSRDIRGKAGRDPPKTVGRQPSVANGLAGLFRPAASCGRRRRSWPGRPEREWLLHRNAALADAAAQGAGLDSAPQHLVIAGKGAAVRHRQPQPQQQPIVALVVVLEGGAGVVYHVVVDELDVAERETHLETQLLGNFGEEIERLPLPVADPRHLAFRPALRRFDIGA